MKKILTFFCTLILVLLLSSFSQALILVEDVNQEKLYPGEEAKINIDLKNDFDYDVEDVSFTLIFNSLTSAGGLDLSSPSLFSSVGSSTESVDEIQEDDSESFDFRIKASNSIEPGDYNLPYRISYKDKNNTIQTETGTIGINVNSKTLLDYSVTQSNKILGKKDKITVTIINKGFGEIKFLSVNLDDASKGFTLLSEDKVYIGSISSDDFDTASFDVLLNSENPYFSAVVTYKDFENNDQTEYLNLELDAYTKEKAIELGILNRNYVGIYIIVIVVLIILWFVYRAVRRRQRFKKSRQLSEEQN